MIALSGLLLLVAAVLLVTGTFSGDVGLVYGAVGACLLSGLLLLLGVLQRRGEVLPAGGPAPAEVEGSAAAPLEQDEDELDGEQPAGRVVVAGGSSRYHLPGCPELAGAARAERDVVEARELGGTPCGTCRPDAALAVAARERELQRAPDEQPGAVRLPHAPDPVVVGEGRLHRLGCPLAGDTGEPLPRVDADALGLPPCERCRP